MAKFKKPNPMGKIANNSRITPEEPYVRSFKRNSALVLLLIVLAWGGLPTVARSADPVENEETLLMFVGENLDVLTIASRHEQSAGQAPAVAQVITRQQIQERGLRTLSQALTLVPGFYMGQKEWGTLPYMRGIPNGVLFLYDSVPMGASATKSLSLLDHEISLTRVKRIEIIRGPGSVLWGPDAYAAIVNIVPLAAEDLEGPEIGVTYGTPGDPLEAFAHLGYNSGRWDTMLSVNGRNAFEDDTSCNLARFWGDGQTPAPPESRLSNFEPERATYLEALANFNYEEWLNLSGHISRYEKSYAMTGLETPYTWQETQQVHTGHVKMEISRKIGLARGVRLHLNYQWLRPETDIIDRTVSFKEDTFYGEVIFDQSFLSGKGLFTGGLSYRHFTSADAPTWDGYLIDYLSPENSTHLPILVQQDHDDDLRSVFGQYTHKFNRVDLMASVRYDDHDRYEDPLSYNLGLVWTFLPAWTMKILYGTAYRTPFPRQLAQGDTLAPEEIGNFSLQLIWKHSSWLEMNLTGYYSRIKNHVMEDPYAGLSEPNDQEIVGMEAGVRLLPFPSLELGATASILDNSGPDETYLYNDYSYIDGDGDLVKHFVELNYPYDTGPRQTFNFTAQWQPFETSIFFTRLQYLAQNRLIHPLSGNITKVSDVWLLDAHFLQKGLFHPKLDFSIAVRNLLNEKYSTPGTYATIIGEPFTLLGTLAIHF